MTLKGKQRRLALEAWEVYADENDLSYILTDGNANDTRDTFLAAWERCCAANDIRPKARYAPVGAIVTVKGHEEYGTRTVVAQLPDIPGGVQLDSAVDWSRAWNTKDLTIVARDAVAYARKRRDSTL